MRCSSVSKRVIPAAPSEHFFKAAAIAGVPLSEADRERLGAHRAIAGEMLKLLPETVRRPKRAIKDDFSSGLQRGLRLDLVAGRNGACCCSVLTQVDNELLFNYGRSYLARPNAISIYEPELPLGAGEIPLGEGLSMPSCIRDASPDAWGRRVLINRKLALKGKEASNDELSEMAYLLESGSDRIGALHFQSSPTKFTPRVSDQASLDELLESAERVEKGLPLQPDLDKALQHGSSIGGARPKALITANDRKFIAKFSTSNDLYNVVKAEFIAMRPAKVAALNVAAVTLQRALGKNVLLVERFDREKALQGWLRKSLVSALTMFGLDEMMAKYASYQDLADIIRHRFTDQTETLHELFGRLTFNILCGNMDDHARNHAAFWDGKSLTLTPTARLLGVRPHPGTR